MSKLKNVFAPLLLGAAAFVASGSDAEAQSRPASGHSALDLCNEIGRTNGVHEFPAIRKAFQDSRGIGCEYGYGAGGNMFAVNAYNLSDARQANAYSRTIEQAERAEERAIAQAERQQRRDYERSLPGQIERDIQRETRRRVNREVRDLFRR